MRKIRVSRPSPATVISMVALFVAISGTAVALPGTNTVDSGDIKNGEVKTTDLDSNAVTTGKIANTEVRRADLRDTAVDSTKVEDESLTSSDLGADSVNSSELGSSAVGADELTTIIRRSATSATIANNTSGSASVQCNAGEQVLAGGNDASTTGNGFAVIASRNDGANGWRVFVRNQTGANQTVTVHAYCLQQ